jgi:hypothetical protein
MQFPRTEKTLILFFLMENHENNLSFQKNYEISSLSIQSAIRISYRYGSHPTDYITNTCRHFPNYIIIVYSMIFIAITVIFKVRFHIQVNTHVRRQKNTHVKTFSLTHINFYYVSLMQQ